MAEGIPVTMQLTLLSFALGLALGSVLAAARVFGSKPVSVVSRAYIEFFRGTPLLVQIFFIYFGLPALGIRLDAFWAAIVAIGFNSASYQAEILRSAIKSIPEEQYLAAESLGMSTVQTYRFIIFPQAIRVATPALVNEFVALIKYTSLASIIGVAELFRRTEYMVSYTFRPEIYLLSAAIYLAICLPTSQFSKMLESKYAIPGYRRALV
ncbi:MAG: amino acid ABC transporter permease [Nitrososphaerota archaeon]|nr:amino acid ABC transporter permease [Candidatus Calditenuaceae archaeon]MDW8073569.1 amino acid ABC transporter permease [Nitrososphaerota archaeon]